jgi:putative hemolysin
MIILALASLVLIGIFAGAETVLVSADRIHIRRRIESGTSDRYLHRILSDPRTSLSATLAATSVFTILTSALVNVGVASRWGQSAAGLATVGTVLAILIVGEVLPKTIGRARADALFPVVAPVVYWSGIVLWPVLRVATIASNVLLALLGVRAEGRRGLLARADLQVLLREVSGDPRSPRGGASFLGRVLDFGKTPLSEVLVPRTDLAAVEADHTPAEALEVAARTRHSRIVVYKESVDAVIGLVHIFDLLQSRAPSVGDLARPVLVLPESVSSLDAFGRLAETGSQVAFVADEFGGIAGIVSIGDLLEELTGRRSEDALDAPALIRPLGEHRWLVQGRTPIEELSGVLGVSIPPGAYETIAGYLLARTGTIPEKGTSVQSGSWRFTVHAADRRRVLSVLVERLGTEAALGRLHAK